ncbi:hypothetical protein LTR50_005470 [Elasticomyces elasticus]|nr:hypothetical protein LTR50_005470 [Elasticomyces elasticus]
MPYNNTPIAPSKEVTGTVSLPLARVKKIISADDDVQNCSNNAAFVITVAAEMFVQYMVERTHDVVRTEKKPRRNIQYKDVANAVARVENLEFLTDVVPKTTTFKTFKEDQARKAAASANKPRPLSNGQTTIPMVPNHRMPIPINDPADETISIPDDEMDEHADYDDMDLDENFGANGAGSHSES